MPTLAQKYNQLLAQNEALLKENSQLRSLLLSHDISFETSKKEEDTESVYSPVLFPSLPLSPDQKVDLFMSYFKGRTDIFARRWLNKTTLKTGYQPVCLNEWQEGKCDKKAYRCLQCPNKNFKELSSSDIYHHLEGKDLSCQDVVGLYAIMPDNSCALLCTDFDDKSCTHRYKRDVLSFVGVCRDWGIPYAMERSRSGNGAHVWIFFGECIPAQMARRLGNAILSEAMSRDGRMSFNSYDRFFPSQDFVRDDGLGNLVALPLQGQARKKLNSVFVDERFLAYRDQWAFLASVRKIERHRVEALLSEYQYEELGALTVSTESKPWETPTPRDINQSDFPSQISIILSNGLYIPLSMLSQKVLNHLKRIASFKNPEFFKKQKLRLSTAYT